MFRIFSFCCILACTGFIYAQNGVSFIKEYIDFKIDSLYFSVNGIYTFTNKADTTTRIEILYPFPIPSSGIYDIRVNDFKDFKKIPFDIREKDIVFPIKMLSRDTLDILIYYKQRISEVNTYILTTTKYWKQPLEKANYTLTIDKPLKVSGISLVPDSIDKGTRSDTYYWARYNFLPVCDFTVRLSLGTSYIP
jgi:hypothetical protein